MTKIFKAIFPLILVLLFFAIFRRKELRNGAVMRFLIVAASVNFCIRFTLSLGALGDFKFATRYFYSLAVIAICFAAPGVIFLSDWLKNIFNRKYPAFSAKHALGIVLIITAAICLGKALRFKSDDKRWIYETADAIKVHSKTGGGKVLISNNPDRRAAYYAGTEFIKLITPEDTIFEKASDNKESKKIVPEFGMLARSGIKKNAGRFIRIPSSNGLTDFKKNLLKLPENTFILMRMDDTEFRKYFHDASIPFPLKLIKKMRDNKKCEICLYVLNFSHFSQSD